MLQIKFKRISGEIALRWMLLNTVDDESPNVGSGNRPEWVKHAIHFFGTSKHALTTNVSTNISGIWKWIGADHQTLIWFNWLDTKNVHIQTFLMLWSSVDDIHVFCFWDCIWWVDLHSIIADEWHICSIWEWIDRGVTRGAAIRSLQKLSLTSLNNSEVWSSGWTLSQTKYSMTMITKYYINSYKKYNTSPKPIISH